jgi:periplasmic copper chaperone A
MSGELRLSRRVPRAAALAILAATTAVGVAGCRAARGGHVAAGGLRISHAVVTATAEGEASAFLLLENGSDTARSLVGATTDVTDSVMMHHDVGGQMQPVAEIPVPAGGRVLLAPGHDHLMLEGLRHPLAVGDTVTLNLLFSPGGPVSVRAPVLRYTEAVSELPVR